MENVHGIAVFGGSFPAEIWHLFMEQALGTSPPRDWVEPAELPTWTPWQRGPYSLSYDPYAATRDVDDETTETTTEHGARAASHLRRRPTRRTARRPRLMASGR